MIIFTIDFIISTYASFKLKNSLSKIDKDSTEEIKEKIKEKIESKFLNRRIFKAYPKYKINIIKRLEEYRKEKNREKVILYFFSFLFIRFSNLLNRFLASLLTTYKIRDVNNVMMINIIPSFSIVVMKLPAVSRK